MDCPVILLLPQYVLPIFSGHLNAIPPINSRGYVHDASRQVITLVLNLLSLP